MVYEDVEKLRKEKGMSIAELSRATGIPYSTFTDWRAGRYTPKHDKIKKLEEFFGVSPTVHTYGQSPAYYLDKETADIAQEIFDNSELRVLFDAARDAKPENLKLAAEMLRRFKETNPDG